MFEKLLNTVASAWRKVSIKGNEETESNPLINKDENQLVYPLSSEQMNKFFQENNACPDCHAPGDKILGGPSGGGAQNIKCSSCGSFFNDMMFGLDRIAWFNHHGLVKACHPEITNYTPHTPHIINNWTPVYIANGDGWTHIYRWCGENCKGKWSVKSGKLNSGGAFSVGDESTFFFEKADDDFLVLFKLSSG